ncbi:MAG TPA: antitoxin MazE family protein [Rhizomicrobium sp.]
MPAPLSSAKKVRAHRAKLRRQGLRPIQIWVPDVNDPKIIEQIRHEARAIAQSPQEKDNLAFIASLWDDASFEK